MVTYTSAFLAAANLLALAHAAPAQPVCSVVTTVITGKPIWVPRADPTTAAGWSDWQGKGSSSSSTKKTTTTTSYVSIPTTWTNGGGFYTASTSTWSTSSIPVISITVTPTTWSTTTDVPTTTPVVVTPTTSSAPPPAATCAASGISTFEADGVSGSCGCEFAVTCNMHAPYTADTSFWERTSGEIIGSLAECQAICNDNAACTAAIWVNKDGAPSSEYMRCWQTSNLPQPNDDGYGQLSYKGSCSGSCSSSYNS